jgi:hypothetical protein
MQQLRPHLTNEQALVAQVQRQLVEGSMEVYSNSAWKLVTKGQDFRFDACQPHG